MVCSVFSDPDLGCSPRLTDRVECSLSLLSCLLQHLLAKAAAYLPLCWLASRQSSQQAIVARQVTVTHWDVIFGLALGACRQARRLGVQVPVDVSVLWCSVACLLERGCCQLLRDIGERSRLCRQHSSGLGVLLGGACFSRSVAVWTGCL